MGAWSARHRAKPAVTDCGIREKASEEWQSASGPRLYRYVEGNPVNGRDPWGLTPEGAAVGAAIGASAVLAGSIVADAATGGLNILATPAEVAVGAAIGAVIGDAISNVYEMAKGERGWGKKRGDDPLWDEDIESLKEIEKKHPNPKVRENAKKIRKMKEKTKGKPCN